MKAAEIRRRGPVILNGGTKLWLLQTQHNPHKSLRKYSGEGAHNHLLI